MSFAIDWLSERGVVLCLNVHCSTSYLLDDTEVACLFVQLSLAEVDHHVLTAGRDLEEGHQDGGE